MAADSCFSALTDCRTVGINTAKNICTGPSAPRRSPQSMEKQDIRTDCLILFFQDPVSHMSERRRRQQKYMTTKRSDAGCSELVRILVHDCPADSWRISRRESSRNIPWQERQFLEGSTLPISIIHATALLHDEAMITLDAVILQQAGEICSDRETTFSLRVEPGPEWDFENRRSADHGTLV